MIFFLDSQANNYSSFSQSLSFMWTPISGGPSFESLLMRMDDIRSQSGRSNVNTRFCTMMGEETIRQLLHADSISVMMSFLRLWPGVRATDNRWCSWSNPQCSRLHERTLQRSSPGYWLSCWSYWWTPRRGRHTGNRCGWAQHQSQLQRDWEFEQKHH